MHAGRVLDEDRDTLRLVGLGRHARRQTAAGRDAWLGRALLWLRRRDERAAGGRVQAALGHPDRWSDAAERFVSARGPGRGWGG